MVPGCLRAWAERAPNSFPCPRLPFEAASPRVPSWALSLVKCQAQPPMLGSEEVAHALLGPGPAAWVRRVSEQLQAWPLPCCPKPMWEGAEVGVGVGTIRVDLDNFRRRMEVRAETIGTCVGGWEGGGGLPAHMLHRVPAGEDWKSEGWFFLCTPFCATLGAETSQGFPQGNFCLLMLSTLLPHPEGILDPW